MDYLSQVIKSQRARKSLSVINIFGLSVCISAALLILLYVRCLLYTSDAADE